MANKGMVLLLCRYKYVSERSANRTMPTGRIDEFKHTLLNLIQIDILEMLDKNC